MVSKEKILWNNLHEQDNIDYWFWTSVSIHFLIKRHASPTTSCICAETMQGVFCWSALPLWCARVLLWRRYKTCHHTGRFSSESHGAPTAPVLGLCSGWCCSFLSKQRKVVGSCVNIQGFPRGRRRSVNVISSGPDTCSLEKKKNASCLSCKLVLGHSGFSDCKDEKTLSVSRCFDVS